GQQIPAYYYGAGKDDFVVAESVGEAIHLARTKSGNENLKKTDLSQDPDVLDTWFSSWLWPISVFNGILDPENQEINYYYPTQDLVTAPEILFFWVARMIVAGYEYRGERPFENVYLTGIVRDKQRRKMSKSLGNSPDPLELIEKYGADGVRVGMLLSSPAGNDLMFDEDLCKQGSAFVNKIWNAYRLIHGWEVAVDKKPEATDALTIMWYENKFQAVLAEIEDHYTKYRMSDALMATYKLVWDDFCSWFLEMIKPAYEEPISEETYLKVIALFEDNLRILHPFVPFISEHIWQNMAQRDVSEALIISKWPELKESNDTLIKNFENAMEVISAIRTIRKERNIAFKEKMELLVINHENLSSDFDGIISK